MMIIKFLFFDTSALIKIFLEKEDGADTIRWLISSQTKIENALHFVINDQVCKEFEQVIRRKVRVKEISDASGIRILRQFSKRYRGAHFEVIEQRPISENIPEISLEEAINDLGRKKGKNDWDALIYQSIVNALAHLAGESRPILVTADKPLASKVEARGYRVINPVIQDRNEILALLK